MKNFLRMFSPPAPNPRDIDIVKMKSKDISKPSVAVENFPGVLHYICENVKRSLQLTTFLKDELTQLFGKYNTRFRGEYLYYVWILEFDGEEFHAYTANGYGTQFSVVAKYEDDKAAVCMEFLGKMERLLVELKQKPNETLDSK